MSTLEQIVRPSVVPGIRPLGFSVPRTQVKVPGDNTITWGNAGNDIFTITARSQQTVKNDLPADEIKRTYDTVKVINPDDEEQSVTMEAMTEYQARNQIDKSRVTLRFAKNVNSATTKVLSRGNVRKTGVE